MSKAGSAMTIYDMTERDLRRAKINLEHAEKQPNVPAYQLERLRMLYALRKEIFEKIRKEKA